MLLCYSAFNWSGETERNSFEALGTWIESDHDTKAGVLVHDTASAQVPRACSYTPFQEEEKPVHSHPLKTLDEKEADGGGREKGWGRKVS